MQSLICSIIHFLFDEILEWKLLLVLFICGEIFLNLIQVSWVVHALHGHDGHWCKMHTNANKTHYMKELQPHII
jgi:hypothetical protein